MESPEPERASPAETGAEPVFGEPSKDSTTISMSNVGHAQAWYYAVAGVYCKNFVVTEQYRNLVKVLNEKKDPGVRAVLQGSKGVGKSATLGVLASVAKLPTLLFSLRVECHVLCTYLQSLGSASVSDSPPPSKKARYKQDDLNHYVCKALGDLKEKDHVVLLDLSSLTTAGSDVLCLAAVVLAHTFVCKKAIGVVAHSSRMATFEFHQGLPPVFKNQLTALNSCHHVEFVPFSDREADIYWKTTPSHLPLKDVEPLTGNNPLLLSACQHSNDILRASQAVWYEVTTHAKSALRSLQARSSFWCENNLNFCLRVLFHASNATPIPKSGTMDNYTRCWLAVERITYIAGEDKTHFLPKVNFPLMSTLVMDHLREEVSRDIVFCNEIMKGYRFEHEFLTKVSSLSLTCNKHEESDEVSPNVVLTFRQITATKSCAGMPVVTTLLKGELINLREKHPVIDAVGILEDGSGKEWLLLLQVSLSTYAIHHSKAADLMKNVTWPEKKCVSADCTWLKYYKDCCETELDCMYVYVSPKEVDQNPAETMRELGIKCRTRGMYFGFVTHSSDTHTFITEIVSKLP